jgi:hypothetical protein
MTAALTPRLALDYLAELQPALASTAVVGTEGELLAGDSSLAAAGAGSGGVVAAGSAGSGRVVAAGGAGSGRVVAAGGGSGRVVAAGGGSGRVVAAGAGGHIVIAQLGPGALEPLVRHDLEMVARELG